MKSIVPEKKVIYLLCSTVVLGMLIFFFTYYATVADLKQELLQKTEIVFSSINIEDVKALTGTQADYLLEEYQRLLQQLTLNLQTFDPSHKNLYIMTKSGDGDIVFLIDLERSTIRNEVISLKTIGEVYNSPSAELRQLAEQPDAMPFVEGPLKDEYGIWISALIPIVDPESHQTLAIIGIDYTSTEWKWTIVKRLIYPILLLILLFFLFLFAFQLSKTHRIVVERTERIKTQRDVLSKISMSDMFREIGFENTLKYLIKMLTESLHVSESSLWLISEDNTAIVACTVHSVSECFYHEIDTLKIAEHTSFFAYIHGSHVLSITDVSQDPILTDFFIKTKAAVMPQSAIFVNIASDRKIVGVVAIADFTNQRKWHSDELSFAQSIAAAIYQVIGKRERELSKRELQEQKQRFEDTLESINDGYIYSDKDKHIKFINHRTFEILNFDLKEAEYETIWIKLPTDIAEFVQGLLDEAIEKNTNIEQVEYVARLEKWIEFRIYPTRDDLAVFFSDVTKKNESEKTHLENQRLSAIEEMANAFSHDFNNYLQVILSNVEVLSHKLILRVDTFNYLNKILLTTKDAMIRVQLLQRFAGTKNKDSEYDRVDINEVVKEAIQQSVSIWKVEPEKEGHSITLNREYGNVPDILGNDNELRSVVYNLIKNAVEAIPGDGSIVIKTGTNDAGVYIRLTDSGEGMNEEVARRVFEPFYTTRGFETGKGLGLCVVYNIIAEHSGTVRVVSTKLGEGTTFEVTLPYHLFPERVPDPKDLDMPKPRILWVDDDDFIRQIGLEMFEIMGYDITMAESGEQALLKLKEEHFDVLLSDIGMPNMNGWQLMKTVNELYPDKYKRVLISGWGDQYSKEQAAMHKIDRIITKPVKIQQLQKLIKDLWEG